MLVRNARWVWLNIISNPSMMNESKVMVTSSSISENALSPVCRPARLPLRRAAQFSFLSMVFTVRS
jgi:hypothetical protein